MFISQAHAAAEGAPAGGGFEMLIMLGMFAVIFYFMIYRPQAKRVKEHKNLMSSMGKGDEVLTSGGLIGKITKISKRRRQSSVDRLAVRAVGCPWSVALAPSAIKSARLWRCARK